MDVDKVLQKLWEYANDDNACNVKVLLDDGYKEYKICDGVGKVVLDNEKEEKVFLMFKFPEVYDQAISNYLKDNKDLLNEYFKNPNAVRKKLRNMFKSDLMFEARNILTDGEKEVKVVKPKPVHKSKTVAFNTTLIISSAILLAKGLAEHNYDEIEKALAVLIPAIVNFILRLVTKHPIKI